MVEWQTRSAQNAVPTGREGSTPSLVTDSFRGRLTVGRQALNLSGVGSTPAPGTGNRARRAQRTNLLIKFSASFPNLEHRFTPGNSWLRQLAREPIDRDVLLGEQCASNPHREGSTPSVLADCPVKRLECIDPAVYRIRRVRFPYRALFVFGPGPSGEVTV